MWRWGSEGEVKLWSSRVSRGVVGSSMCVSLCVWAVGVGLEIIYTWFC